MASMIRGPVSDRVFFGPYKSDEHGQAAKDLESKIQLRRYKNQQNSGDLDRKCIAELGEEKLRAQAAQTGQ